MINASAAFKAALENDNRNFSGSCTITLASGKSIPIDDSQLWDNGFVINDSTSSTGGFDIGSAIVQKFTLRLNNMYDDFTEYDFTGAEISNIKVSLSLSGKTEAVSKGVFTVNDTSYDGDIVTLECLDNMHKFDVNYSKSKPVPGFYAEDVYKQYPEGVIFNEDGQIEDWNYRTMIPAMMKVIQDQNERINTLEDTVNALNERLNKLEGMLKGAVK